MIIEKNKLKLSYWYEDADGNRLETNEDLVTPAGARTMHTVYPTQVDERICGLYDKNKKCKHRRTRKDNDLKAEYKGRTCLECGRSQVTKKWRPWPKKWNEGASSYELMTFHMHLCKLDDECVVAMVNSGDYTLREAMAVMAQACERCGNVLIHKYLNGKDGYEEFSEEWFKANTECGFCKDLEDGKTCN